MSEERGSCCIAPRIGSFGKTDCRCPKIMTDSWRMIDYSSKDPAMNLAIDEAILRSVLEQRSPNTLRLWRNPSTVVIGHFQEPESVTSFADCRTLKVRIVRRGSGGGAVYHDYGNLNYSVIVHKSLLNANVENVEESYNFFCAGIIEGLKDLGVQAFNCGGNIMVEGKKISGSAQHRLYDGILHHGTLMVNVDLQTLGRTLRIPDPDNTLMNLSEILRDRIPVNRIKKAVKIGYEKAFDATFRLEKLSLYEERMARRLHQLKYNTKDWNG